MQTKEATKRNYWVTSTDNGENFEERQGFKTWAEALNHLNYFIKQQPMSIFLTENHETVKEYKYKQRVSS